MSNQFAAVRHGRFIVEVPEGWADDSTLSFTAPIKESLSAPLSPRRAPSFQSNVHITVELRPDGLDNPIHFLQLLGDNLRQAGAALEDVKPPEAFSFAGRDGAIVERRVSLNNEAMRQFTAVCFEGPNIIMASASTSESEAAAEGAVLLEILKRVKFE